MSAILFNPDEMMESSTTTSHINTTIINDDDDNAADDGQQQPANTISQICDELIADAMSALELHDEATELALASSTGQSICCGGSDSGVEIATSNICSTTMMSTTATGITLQRALSSNSGGYTSSNGCYADESLNTTTGQNVSCNSSLISCNSDLFELKVNSTNSATTTLMTRSPNNYECCSENGSESSSVLGRSTCPSTCVTPSRRINSGSVKKKVAMFEPNSKAKDVTTIPSSQSNTRGRISNLKRAVSLPRSNLSQVRTPRQVRPGTTTLGAPPPPTQAVNVTTPTTPARSVRPQKPDTLPSALSRTQSISMQRLVQRTPSLSRARTPGTPSDDGRWPTTSRNPSRRGMSVTPDLATYRMRTNLLPTSECGNQKVAVSPFSTMPRNRRKQHSVEDLTAGGRVSRSNSITRESRMTSSVVVMQTRKSLAPTFAMPTQTAKTSSTRLTSASSAAASRKMPQPKTRIYHETAVQTALTSHDLDQVLSGGMANARAIDAVEQREQSTQSDIRDAELERLRDELRQMTQREHELSAKLQREREEKLMMRRELHLNTERVMGMLEMARVVSANAGTPTSEEGDGNSGHDSLLMLESQIQMSGHELIERQQEIGQLRQLCRSLQMEMQRSLVTQECLLQEKAVIEQESIEMQDFLQHEKSAMCDALKELEADFQASKQQLTNREEEVKVLRDECRHLVRLNEQRRQENRLLQTKFAALESKSKEMMMQQSASVAGASSALAGLHARLDNLVEQLVYSYSISEQDLEDIGFQNEALPANGNGEAINENNQNGKANANGLDLPLHQGGNAAALQAMALSSDGSLSPQRNQSFIAAVISAIRNATTTHSGKRHSLRHGKRMHQQQQQQHSHSHGGHSHEKHNGNGHGHGHELAMHNGGEDSDSTEMLDSETEPCLMMDNVLEDVIQPDSHSHNMVSSGTNMISQIELPSELVNLTTTNGDDSLQQLSQAITNRQQMEQLHMKLSSTLPMNGRDQCNTEDLSCHDSLSELPSLMEYSTTQAVVDQVIEVDTLVTKLLKVLRLIQLDNDNCIQQLIVDKNKLQQHKEDMLEKLKDLEDVNLKLQDELMDATQELMLKSNDLSSTKAEMQRHRNEIDRLNEDICTLSTLCSNYKKLSPTTEFPPMQLLAPLKTPPEESDTLGILNLLKIWQADGQLQDKRVYSFLNNVCGMNFTKSTSSPSTHSNNHNNNNNNSNSNSNNIEARLRIYANQLENVLNILSDCTKLEENYPALQQLRKEIECVKQNASWTQMLCSNKVQVDTSETSSKDYHHQQQQQQKSETSSSSSNNITNKDNGKGDDDGHSNAADDDKVNANADCLTKT